MTTRRQDTLRKGTSDVPRDPVDALLKGVPDSADTQVVGLIGRMFRIQAHLERGLAEMLRPFGIDRGQSDVLGTLSRAGSGMSLTPGVLSASLMCSTGAMTNRLDRLEAAGLIQRDHDPADRRGSRISLTDQGAKAVAGIATARQQRTDVLIPGLSPEERKRLEELLRRLLIGFETSTRAESVHSGS